MGSNYLRAETFMFLPLTVSAGSIVYFIIIRISYFLQINLSGFTKKI